MTDFIHEPPKDPQSAPAPETEREERPLSEADGQKRVYGYIFLLFIVAFSLLLWSFLMNQRSNEQVLSELRGSANTLQSTLDRNIGLEQRVSELESEIKALEGEVTELEQRSRALQSERDEALAERDKLQAELAAAQAALAAEAGGAESDPE